MGPTWGPPGTWRSKMGPLLAHEPCLPVYQLFWMMFHFHADGGHEVIVDVRGGFWIVFWTQYGVPQDINWQIGVTGYQYRRSIGQYISTIIDTYITSHHIISHHISHIIAHHISHHIAWHNTSYYTTNHITYNITLHIASHHIFSTFLCFCGFDIECVCF